MKARSVLRPAVASAMLICLTLGSSLISFAQDSRPRYSSRQHYDSGFTIPEDTIISVRMNGSLSSRNSHVGDKFTATVDVPVYVNGRAVIPAGSIVEGRVTQVTPAKRMGRSGTIAIDFDDLVFPDGSRIPLSGNLTSDDPETRRRIDDESRVSGADGKRTGVFVGGGGAVGAVLGGIAGGGKGAVVGGVLGAGAGIAAVLLSKGEEAQVSSGTPFGVQLRQAIVVRDQPATAANESASDNDSYAGRHRRPDRPDRPDRNSDPIADSEPNRTSPADPIRTQPTDARPDVRPEEPMPDSVEPEPEPRAEPPVSSGPPLPLSSPEMISRAQRALKEQGYYEGAADGSTSPRYHNSLKAYQRENNLPETGELDQETARKLGILGNATPAGRGPRDVGSGIPTDRPNNQPGAVDSDSRTVLANVLSASANRTADGAIFILINTQANTGGWRWYGEHVVNGDTLEVYARAVRPTGMVTQALTRGKIELNVREDVDYIRRVVIHSAGPDQVISLGTRGNTTTPPQANANTQINLQRQAEELLSEYQRISGVRASGNGIQIDNSSQYKDQDVELFFALDSFANAARLYQGLIPSLQDQQSLRSATLSLAQQAKRTDRVMTTTSSRAAKSLMMKWDLIRQDVLRLMQSYGIGPAELDQ